MRLQLRSPYLWWMESGLAPRGTNFMMGVKTNHVFKRTPFAGGCYPSGSRHSLNAVHTINILADINFGSGWTTDPIGESSNALKLLFGSGTSSNNKYDLQNDSSSRYK